MASKANLTAVISAVDKVSGPMKRIQRSLRQPVRAFAGLGKSVANVGGRISGILGPLGALGGALSVAGLVNTVNGFARGADEISKFSRQIGLSAEAYQELTFASDRQGVSQDLLNTSLIAFTKRLGEMKAGTGGLHTLLQKVNPELREQLIAAESTEAAFNLMIDSLGRLEGEENKAALAAAAFSRSGVAMVRVSEAGADGIAALRAEARRLGVVIDNDTAAAAEGFVDSLTNMEASLTGVKNLIGASLMPQLQPIIDRFTEWAVKNREIIATRMGSFVEKLAAAISSIEWNAVVDGLTRFADGVAAAVDFLGGWDNAAIALVALMNGPLIASLASVGASFVKLGAILFANPIGAIVLLIAYAAYKIYQNWGPIEAWFKKMWGSITQIFGGAYDIIAGLLTGDMERVVQGLYDIWDGFKAYWDGLWEGIGGVIREAWNDIKGVIKSVPFGDKILELASSFIGGGDGEKSEAQQGNAFSKENRAAMLQGSHNKFSGQVDVNVNGLPPGSTVTTTSQGDGEINADVGHRRFSPMGAF